MPRLISYIYFHLFIPNLVSPRIALLRLAPRLMLRFTSHLTFYLASYLSSYLASFLASYLVPWLVNVNIHASGRLSVLHLLPAHVPGGDPAAPPGNRARRLRPAARSPARAVQEEGPCNLMTRFTIAGWAAPAYRK